MRSWDMRWARVMCVGDVSFMTVVVVGLVGLEVELVVGGGCRWGCRPLVKRPFRNIPGLGRHCSRRRRGAVVVDVWFGSRGGGF